MRIVAQFIAGLTIGMGEEAVLEEWGAGRVSAFPKVTIIISPRTGLFVMVDTQQ